MDEAKQTNKPYHLINMADVVAKEVDWLWFPYILLGKLTIVQGDPGEGKTTFVLQLAVLLSKGEMLPSDDKEREPVNVIYQTTEDGLEDKIKPRLLEAGADCSKIMVIDESQKELSMTDERLVIAIEETGTKLVILDPIQAYLGADVDMHRANEIRSVLKRLGWHSREISMCHYSNWSHE
jgi:RecA-family ATPase